MLLTDLFEAPLADINMHGDNWDDTVSNAKPLLSGKDVYDNMTQNSFVSKVDRAHARNPEVHAKLYSMFEKHGEKFYLYLVNSPEMSFFHDNLDWGILNPTKNTVAFSMFPKEMRQQVISRNKEKAIQVILTHNEGGKERHPLTPWTIMHRIVHAFFGANADMVSAPRSLVDQEAMRTCFNNFFVKAKEGYEGLGYTDTPTRHHYLTDICTFKSARDRNILVTSGGNYMELYVELMTQYLWHGKIIFKEAPPRIIQFNHGFQYSSKKRPEARDVETIYKLTNPEVINDSIRILKDSLEKLFADAIKQAEGKIIVC
jgi:hypothetical protein